ncbi:addiction module antitoxin [Jannaschia pagri]|uniref:Addiction module antitoxin n=1 Tax=Jannaschia pagri TaxID=2829797 RepID=A0ABQ4NRS8_9RHOB|nr:MULTISPECIES: type II toxin-antitoxin system ParD family antitoxin [unclassified Jannaschia]GIT93309.1 addiction module antitoxin [Jannaschia sp. AI_61]GIT97117.1 addiction module antitoxin [Jannaschia sp. AI_62]
MQNVERLSITLPKDMAQTVRGAVSGGGYASNSEVIREAVRLWQETHAARLQRAETLRAAVAAADADPRPNLSEADVDAHFAAKLAKASMEPRD